MQNAKIKRAGTRPAPTNLNINILIYKLKNYHQNSGVTINYNSEIHHRRSIRLKEYDYSQNAAYFITICVEGKQCLFGNIINEEMQLNIVGEMIDIQWNELPNRFNVIQLDEYVVMPNHFHGIIIIDAHVQIKNPTIGNIIGAFKSITTNEYIKGVKSCNWQTFDKRIWQKNYYEHIIRNEKSLDKIREYIIYNPANWEKDELYKL